MIRPVSNAAPDPADDPTGDPVQEPGRHVGGHLVGGQDEDLGEVTGAHLAEEPAEPTFPHKPFLRVGYDRGSVDQFVARVVLAIHNERQTSVSPEEVAGKKFPSRRLGRGYRMREVDDYLGAAEALLRMRAAERGAGPDSGRSHEEPTRHHHHATWWVFGIAAVLIVVIIVFTLAQT
jgi:DivIVA domain-containing protein